MDYENLRDELLERIEEYKNGELPLGILKSELMASIFSVASQAIAEQIERDVKTLAHQVANRLPEPAYSSLDFYDGFKEGVSLSISAIRSQSSLVEREK